jgi:hypothetical protein
MRRNGIIVLAGGHFVCIFDIVALGRSTDELSRWTEARRISYQAGRLAASLFPFWPLAIELPSALVRQTEFAHAMLPIQALASHYVIPDISSFNGPLVNSK